MGCSSLSNNCQEAKYNSERKHLPSLAKSSSLPILHLQAHFISFS
ncbi:hypothetical protein I3843_06G040500 [Carya illinoinensis]|nr:hypothetical protein I3760_06G044200 [Carya illinoinensis]KAG7974270.1 hypothetical protein I3843_06G040500 [Carya illinoinensis]